jgi:uncharacterized ParB-like nuclease family protein
MHGPELLRDFSVRGAARCAEAGVLEEWIHAYLRTGHWANLALSDGLKLEERFWVGPAEVRLDDVDQPCGPGSDKRFREPEEKWERKIAELLGSISDVLDLPPLIVSSGNGTFRNPDGTVRFLVADGCHRLEALRRMGRERVHVLAWFETEAQRTEYLRERNLDPRD